MKKWEELPIEMQVEEVGPYYEALKRKQFSLFLKRAFDIVVSFLMLVILSPVFLILALAIKLDSPGPVFFRQVRVTQYGKRFRIFKFRTMVSNAEKIGAQVTTAGDARITRVGKIIRKCRLDEIAQLIDVLRGAMTFVGVRPEVIKYVDCYTPEMLATLLLPAGVTNLTCIFYKDEGRLLADAKDVDGIYIKQVLPSKMKWNLKGIMDFSFWRDIKLMFMTFLAMLGKEYKSEEFTGEYVYDGINQYSKL
jgi:lipopolysaccharide/colanic/teichoic acid biosynthesis glycosyltransferase